MMALISAKDASGCSSETYSRKQAKKSTGLSGSKSTAQITKRLCSDFLTTPEVVRMKSPIRQERAFGLTA